MRYMLKMRYMLGWACLLGLAITAFSVSAGESRFLDNGDGTVTDRQLAVMWAKTDNHGNISWRQARKWVRYTFPSTIPTFYPNWRLPRLEELESLYVADEAHAGYETDCGQWVKTVEPIRLSCGWVWAAETQAITAQTFNFHQGYHYSDRMAKTRHYRVLPVRNLEADGPSPAPPPGKTPSRPEGTDP